MADRLGAVGASSPKGSPEVTASLFIGMDLGGTNARAAAVEASGRVVAVSKKKLTERAPEAVALLLAEAVREVKAQLPGVNCRRYTVGVPGQVRGSSGVVAMAPNLGWHEVDFKSILSRQLGENVRVVNDLSAAAWGEAQAGVAKGARDVFFVFVGSGVGGALICEGALVQGADGVAGEFGHVKVVPGGRRCGCGAQGCLEAYVGGHHLVAQMREEIDRGGLQGLKARLKGNAEGLTAAMLEEAAMAQDEAAMALHTQACAFLSLAVANQVTLLNPSYVVLGGGVLQNAPIMRKRVAEGVAQWATETSREKVKVVQAALGDDSGLVGAALLGVDGTWVS